MSATATAVPTWGELGYRAMRLLNEWGRSVGRRFAARGIRKWRRANFDSECFRRARRDADAAFRARFRAEAVGSNTVADAWRAIQAPMVFNLATWQMEPATPAEAEMQRAHDERVRRAQAEAEKRARRLASMRAWLT